MRNEQMDKLGIFRFSVPLSSVIHQPSFQIPAFSIGIYSLVAAFIAISAHDDLSQPHLTYFRCVGDDRVLGIKYMYRGCPTASFPTFSSSNRTWHLSNSLTFDGFVLTFPYLEVGGQPTGFSLQSSSDGGATWVTVGAPRFRWTSSGVRFLSGTAPVTARELHFDMRPPWPWLVQNVLEPAIVAASLLCAAAFGVLQQAAIAKLAIIWPLFALAAGSCVASIGFIMSGAPREAFAPAAYATAYLPLATALCLSEPLFLDASAALSLIFIVGGRIVADCAVFADCDHLSTSPPIAPALTAALAILHAVLRVRSVAAALRALHSERDRCDSVWRQVAARPGAGAALRQLADLTRSAGQLCAAGPPARQLNRLAKFRAEGGVAAACAAGSIRDCQLPPCGPCLHSAGTELDEPAAVDSDGCGSTADPGNPVRSLDQLYVQARMQAKRDWH